MHQPFWVMKTGTKINLSYILMSALVFWWLYSKKKRLFIWHKTAAIKLSSANAMDWNQNESKIEFQAISLPLAVFELPLLNGAVQLQCAFLQSKPQKYIWNDLFLFSYFFFFAVIFTLSKCIDDLFFTENH